MAKKKSSDSVKFAEDQIEELTHHAQKMAFVQVVNAQPDMTIAQLAQIAEEYELSDLTIGQCFLGERPTTALEWMQRLNFPSAPALPAAAEAPDKSTNTSSAKTSKKTPKKSSKKRSTRKTKRLDEDVLSFLRKRGDWTSAVEIRDRLGKDKFPVRAALHRLIESGQVDYKGKTRGARYIAL